MSGKCVHTGVQRLIAKVLKKFRFLDPPLPAIANKRFQSQILSQLLWYQSTKLKSSKKRRSKIDLARNINTLSSWFRVLDTTRTKCSSRVPDMLDREMKHAGSMPPMCRTGIEPSIGCGAILPDLLRTSWVYSLLLASQLSRSLSVHSAARGAKKRTGLKTGLLSSV